MVEQSNDRRLIPLLVDGLKTGNPAQRALAASAIGLLKPPPRDAIPPLAAALRDPEVDVRTSVLYTLTRLGQQPNGGPGVTPAILGALKDPEPGVRKVAAGAFRSMEAPPRNAIPGLIETLRDESAEVRAAAVWALGEIEDARAIPLLIPVLRDDVDAGVRRVAAWALGSIE